MDNEGYRVRQKTELEMLEHRVTRLETEVLFYANSESLARMRILKSVETSAKWAMALCVIANLFALAWGYL